MIKSLSTGIIKITMKNKTNPTEVLRFFRESRQKPKPMLQQGGPWSGRVESNRETNTVEERSGNTNRRGTRKKSELTRTGTGKVKITNFTGENKGGYTTNDDSYYRNIKSRTNRRDNTRSRSKERLTDDFRTYDAAGNLISSSEMSSRSRTNNRGKTRGVRKEKIYRDGKTKRYRRRI